VLPVDNYGSCSNTPVSTINATPSTLTGQPISCNFQDYDDDVWFSFTTTSSGKYYFRYNSLTVATGTARFGLGMNIYTGTCGSLTEISGGCNYGFGYDSGSSASVTVLLNANTTYILRLFLSNGGVGADLTNSGTFNFCITTPAPPPVNDECIGAITIPVNTAYNCLNSLTNQSNIGATQSPGFPPCINTTADNDVWFKFTAVSADQYIGITNVSNNTVIYYGLYDTCGQPSYSCSGATGIVYGLTIGHTYYMRVYTYLPGINATFDVCVATPPPPPLNDECINATTLLTNNSSVCNDALDNQTTTSATQSLAGCIGTADEDVWYKFVANNTSYNITLSNVTNNINMVFQVFSGDCNSLKSILCSDPNSAVITGLTPGKTYYIRVYTFACCNLVANFKICLTTPLEVKLCPPVATTTLTSDINGTNYQWQVNTGSGFLNINDNINYSYSTSPELYLTNVPSAWNEYQYRCVVDGNNSSTIVIKFPNEWNGSVNANWEDPSNWSCNVVPDANTDVIITNGTVVINSDVTIRSLTLDPGVNFTVGPGYKLTVLH